MVVPDSTLNILSKLVAFPTVSSEPNRALIDYCATLLEGAGAQITLIEDATGKKANLYATIGPTDRPGVLLSGHTDVVPVAGQAWTKPPCEATREDGRIYGRGTADMKGFVACALAAAQRAGAGSLRTPLHLALSYDEEIGCVGVRSMIDMLDAAPFVPLFCIVGEPTSMEVATGHKGKTACRVSCTGCEAHSALAPSGLNAIYLACDTIADIRLLQDELRAGASLDDSYGVPYTTLHVGKIEGGRALNIVPNHAEFDFEIRNLSGDDPHQLLKRLERMAEDRLTPLRADFPEAAVVVEVVNEYPPLDTPAIADVVAFVSHLTGSNTVTKVSFGTEGGLFSSRLGIQTVICGPGSMAQGHKPDEYIAVDQLDRCDAALDRLLDRLEAGL